MGQCCNNVEETILPDEEIDKQSTIEDLIDLFSFRIKEFKEEQIQIKRYIKDPTKEIDYLDLSDGITNEILSKRIEFLGKLMECYSKIVNDILMNIDDNVNDEEISQIKDHLNKISEKYNLSHDPYGELEEEYIKFLRYVKDNIIKKGNYSNR